jgi:hypothetical protein
MNGQDWESAMLPATLPIVKLSLVVTRQEDFAQGFELDIRAVGPANPPESTALNVSL